jgi:hypothetical protein
VKDGVTGTLNRIQKKVVAFTSFMQSVGTRAAFTGASLAAPLTAIFKSGMGDAADTARMARAMEIPIGLYHKLQYAAEAAGVSVQEVAEDVTGKYQGLIARAPGLNPEDAKAAARAQLDLSDAYRAVKGALLPLVSTAAVYAKLFSEFIRNNAGVARTALAVGVGLVALGVTIKLLSVGFAAIIPIALAAWAAITSPVGLLALAAASGLAVGIGLAGLIDNFKMLKEVASGTGETIATTFGALRDALGKGDLALAGKIAIMGFEVVFLKVMEELQFTWLGFKSIFVDTWLAMIAGAKIAWAQFTGGFVKGFSDAIAKVIGFAAGLADAVGAEDLAKSLRDLSDLSSKVGEKARKDAEYTAFVTAKDLTDDLERRKKARFDEFKAAVDARKKAEAVLAALGAKAAAGDTRTGGIFGADSVLRDAFENALVAGRQQVTTTKGTFSGSALGLALGVGDQTKRTNELMRQLRDGEGLAPKKNAEEVAKALAGFFAVK